MRIFLLGFPTANLPQQTCEGFDDINWKEKWRSTSGVRHRSSPYGSRLAARAVCVCQSSKSRFQSLGAHTNPSWLGCVGWLVPRLTRTGCSSCSTQRGLTRRAWVLSALLLPQLRLCVRPSANHSRAACWHATHAVGCAAVRQNHPAAGRCQEASRRQAKDPHCAQ